MRKTNLSFIFFLVAIPFFLKGQIDWYTKHGNLGRDGINQIADLYEDQNLIYNAAGRSIAALDQFGNQNVDEYTGNFLTDYFLVDIGDNGVIQAQKAGDILLEVFTSDTSYIYRLEDSLSRDEIKGPAALRGENTGEYYFFGKENLYKILLDAQGLVNIIWQKENTFGVIASAAFVNENIILCNEAGFIILIDKSGNTIWSKNLEAILLSVKSIDTGFLLSGRKDGKGIIIKTNELGEIVEEKTTNEITIQDIISDENGFVLTTGKSVDSLMNVRKYDTDLSLLWEQNYPIEGRGIKIISSEFGGYLAQGIVIDGNYIFKIGENGSSDFFVDNDDFQPLNINNIYATLPTVTGSFFDPDSDKDGYFFPKGSATSTIFTSGFWISGNDGTKDYASTQVFEYDEDFEYGPTGATPSSWRKVWSIRRVVLDYFKEDASDGVIENPIPNAILTWPAKGNVNFKVGNQTIEIDRELAPFVDVNDDGIYNANDGDYPSIKGDQMILWVLNDSIRHTSASGGEPMEIDLVCSFYGYGCDPSNVFSNTTFLDYTIYNRSDRNYENVRLGYFADFDIGCSYDDLVGSHPEKNSFFAYNADEMDGGTTRACDVIYEENPPLQSATFLDQKLDKFMYFHNDDDRVVFDLKQPSTVDQFINYMNGKWLGGDELTFGGTGFRSGGQITDFAYPGDPSNTDEWSDCNEITVDLDKRTIGSTELLSLPSEGKLNLSVALISNSEVMIPCPAFDSFTSNIDIVKSAFDNGWLNSEIDLLPDTIIRSQPPVLSVPEGALSYLWSTGETTSSITANSAGTYSIVVTTPQGCQIMDEVYVDPLSSVKNSLEDFGINVFPNPANGMVNISFSTNQISGFDITDVSGKILEKNQFSNIQNSYQLERPNFGAGVYFLNFYDYRGKRIQTKKLIFQP